MAVDGWRNEGPLKTWENTTFLMAEGLEHRKNMFWRGPEWLSMVGGMKNR